MSAQQQQLQQQQQQQQHEHAIVSIAKSLSNGSSSSPATTASTSATKKANRHPLKRSSTPTVDVERADTDDAREDADDDDNDDNDDDDDDDGFSDRRSVDPSSCNTSSSVSIGRPPPEELDAPSDAVLDGRVEVDEGGPASKPSRLVPLDEVRDDVHDDTMEQDDSGSLRRDDP